LKRSSELEDEQQQDA